MKLINKILDKIFESNNQIFEDDDNNIPTIFDIIADDWDLDDHHLYGFDD